MTCPRCQHENPAGSKFCLECGAKLALTCTSCGVELPPGAKFCNECGQPLAHPSSSSAAGADRFTSPESYTPKHLAEKILTSKSALEGERKQVTVLFADLKGSMELLADRDPEEARKILDPVLEQMMEAVHRYEGTVNQVMGDGIMALFGAPLALEDHAVRACYAALRLQESVKRHAEDLQRTAGVPISVRVGLNSGEVVVRSIGSDLHMDYTAVGQTTHLAARMEQMALPGSVLITATTHALGEGYVRVRPLGPVTVKGLGDPTEVFELLGAGPARTRLQASAARGLTRFVGRDAEVEAVRQALERARAGHGQVVALVGEAGVGKSRLVRELTHSHRAQAWLVLESGPVSHGKATAYQPVIDLLETYFQVEDRDDTRKIREKITGKLLTLDQALGETLPAFLALLDVPVDDPGWEGLDPPQRRLRTLEAIRRLMVRESRVQPVLLVFEDLHWIDGETQALLESLVDGLPSARILLLVNYRPEYEHRWGGKTYYTQLRIDPLPVASADELLHALVGADDSLATLRRLLIDRTEGNPFFLEECVRTLAETGALSGKLGAYRTSGPIEELKVPATVQAILASRIDRLPAEEKSLLQVAAVIGEHVPYALLETVTGMPDEQLRSALAHLQSGELLYEAGLFPELGYTFKHALTHDVAYASLLHERRRGLHARVMTAIEQRSADQPAEQVDLLAHHAFRGEIWDKAVSYLRRAGARATARSGYREAVRCFEEALEALGHLPASRDTTALAIDLRLDLRTALTPLGHYRRILDLLGEAATFARELQDDRRLGHVIADTCARLRNIGDHAGALDAGQQACALAARVHDRDLQVEASYRLAQAHFAVGDFVRSVDLLRQILPALDREPTPDSSLRRYLAVHSWLALGLASLGQFAEAIEQGEEAVRISLVVDQTHIIIEAQAALGRVHIARGNLERATALFERGLAPGRTWNIWDSTILSGLGYVYALTGRVGEGVALLEEAVEQGQSIDALGIGHATRLNRLVEGYLLAGRLDEARERAQWALDFSRQRKERANEAWALRLLGAVATSSGAQELDGAASYYRDALALADGLGMRPLVAHCHLGLGQLYRRTGEREQAQEHLATATAMYRAMDMGFWLREAEMRRPG